MSHRIHGKRSTYVNHKCRCDACRAANREYRRQERAASQLRAHLTAMAGNAGMVKNASR